MSKWFETWFDSEYYHILYKDRDYSEAENFIDTLIEHLAPYKNATFLDLACGKGRHSIHLNKLGLDVEGCDYSANSISFAKQYENGHLHFFEHDMRNELPKPYDYIVNLFTSFGYFDTDEEHLATLQHIYSSLKPNGKFVFDFLNAHQVIENLVPEEVIVKSDIQFHITRSIINDKITKNIQFHHTGKDFAFQEEVSALTREKLIAMMTKIGFTIEDEFGSYSLSPFDATNSKRLILVLSK